MGEVEHVEVVEVGEDLPLDRAQLVPRQPVMVVVEGYNQRKAHHTIVKRHCPNKYFASQSQMGSPHNVKRNCLNIFSVQTQFQSPESVELGESREVGAVHLGDLVVTQVQRLQAENI